MKIALITEVWLPSVNGIVTRLTATVRELQEQGHEVLIIAPTSTGREYHGAVVRTVPTIRLKTVYGGQPWGLPVPRVARYIADFDPDVVHVASPSFLGIAGVIAARSQRRTLVCSYHTDVAAYAEFYRLGWARRPLWRMLRGLHNAADLNLVTSGNAQCQLAGHGVERLRIWPRGLDPALYRPREPVGRLRDPLAPVEALYVGRLAQEKGVSALLGVAKTPGLNLTLVGDGPYAGALRKLFAPTPAVFTGTLQGAELAGAYAAADVFVFPSMTDTLGLVLLEALASGLPIVAAESPASKELLADCPVARLYPAGDPGQIPDLISDLLTSAPPQARRAQARAWVAAHNWPAATEALLALYREAATVRVEIDYRSLAAAAAAAPALAPARVLVGTGAGR